MGLAENILSGRASIADHKVQILENPQIWVDIAKANIPLAHGFLEMLDGPAGLKAFIKTAHNNKIPILSAWYECCLAAQANKKSDSDQEPSNQMQGKLINFFTDATPADLALLEVEFSRTMKSASKNKTINF